MFCRNCGNEVAEGAAICVNCGFDPATESNFCNNCGVETQPKQIACISCGTGLETKVVKTSSKVGNSSASNPYDGFYRSSDDKVVLGVCGGFAHKFNMSVGTVRIIGFLLFGWLYFLGLLLPELPTKDSIKP